MSEYLHVSVQETDSIDGHRECANAINYLLEQITLLELEIVDIKLRLVALEP